MRELSLRLYDPAVFPTPTKNRTKVHDAPILLTTRAVGRALAASVNRGCNKAVFATVLATALAFAAPAKAWAKVVTFTITGTVASGTDYSGVFGFPPGTDLTGQPYVLVYTFDDTKGTQDFSGCINGQGASYIVSTSTSNPGTAVLRIGTGEWTFGTVPPPDVGSESYRLVTPQGQFLDLDVHDTGSDDVDYMTGYVYPASGTVLTTDCNWEAPFSNSQLLYVPSLGFDIFSFGSRLASGTLFPSAIIVSGPQEPGSGKDLGDCGCNSPGQPQVGGPITIGTGNMFEEADDYQTTGANPLAFRRYYNSLANTEYPTTFATTLGVNWRSTFDRYLDIASSGGQATAVNAERADGQVLTFALNGSTWTSDSDVDVTLTNEGATWVLKDHNDTMETYTAITPSEGQLNSIQLRNGYTQTLHYNANNQLTSVTDSYNRALNFTYANGLLQTLSTPDGLTFTYGYTAGGGGQVLTSVTYSTDPPTSISYKYEDANLPFALTGIIDENGNRYATWTYDDSSGRALTSQHGGGADLTTLTYNDSDGSRTVTNALGVVDTYSFSMLQGAPKVTQISRAATSTTQAAQRQFTYDSNGYLASQTDWNGNQTSYTNDSHGQPTQIIEPLRMTTISYDQNFAHLPHQIITDGLTSTFAYDGSGNLLTRTDTDTTTQNIPYSTNGETETWTYTWQNSLLASIKTPRTDVNGLTRFTYDGSGALTDVTNALGQQTRITQHTGGGLPLTVIDPNTVTTTLTYDARLHLNTSTVHTAAGSLTTTYTYDPAGNLQSVQLPDGSMLTNGYDTAHRLTSVTDLFGQSTAYALDALGDQTLVNVLDANHTVKKTHSGVFDALGRVLQDIGGVGQATAYTYDNNGNALTVTDPLTNKTSRVFDAMNRLTTSTDPANGVTDVTYDAHDRPLTVTDPNGGETAYVYDGFGNPIQQVSPDSGTTVYYYDLDNNLVKRIAATTAVTQLTYDALDRILTTAYPADPSENVTYTYDQPGHGFGIGRLTSVADAAGSLTHSYDERGNVTQELRNTASVRLSTSYAYDAASRVARIGYPSHWSVAYARDIMGRTTGIDAQLIVASARQAMPPVPVVSNIAYEPFGPVTALTFGNNVAETRSLDLDYRMTNLADTGNAAVQNLTYAYDAGDNVRTITDSVNPGNSQTLGYDVLNRLSSATGGYGSYSWTYNPASSRLTETLGMVTTNYGYGPHNNQLLTLSVNGTVTQNIGYTADGNTNSFNPGIMSPDHELITSLNYNQAGQLAAVMSGSDALAQYTYDAFGQRLVKTLPGGAGALYQNDRDGRLLEETDAHGAPQADYVYLDGRPVATISPSSKAVYFLHADRLGTPQLATDNNQQTAWSATYLPFGQTSSVQGLITQNLRFPGQHFDSESGWNHNGFRDYAQDWGRYLETDPVGLHGGINTYAYVNANPFKNVDPKGLCFEDACIGESFILYTAIEGVASADELATQAYLAINESRFLSFVYGYAGTYAGGKYLGGDEFAETLFDETASLWATYGSKADEAREALLEYLETLPSESPQTTNNESRGCPVNRDNASSPSPSQ